MLTLSVPRPVYPVRRPQRQMPAVRRCTVAKMYVPSDSFQGRSPEKKAAIALRTMFTFVACKVVLSQLAGGGRGDIGSYNTEHYAELMKLLEEKPMKDGDEWLSVLMRRNRMLAMRIMDVRAAYCVEDFEWEMCSKIARQDMKDSNVNLMRQYADIAFAKQVEGSNEINNQANKTKQP